MIEREFELQVTPEVKRFRLLNNYNDQERIVTMADIDRAFGHDEVELIRIKNNTSATWYIEEI